MVKQLVCGDKVLDLSSAVVMGVLNVTPDSFSDGGRFVTVDAALHHAESMISEGALIIDIGAESTRPQAQQVTEQQELDRLLPVLEAIKKQFDVIVSVDTSSPTVIMESAKLGAGLINDVRALQREGALAAAAQSNLPICLMHMQGQPQTMQLQPAYESVVDEVHNFLLTRIEACLQNGIAKERLLIDVGFGFGKTLAHNLQLLAQLSSFKTLDCPILVGMSRKSMLGAILGGAPVEQRLFAGLSAATIAALNGAKIIRTHDVKATIEALAVVNALAALGEN
ncbi:MAG: dihydropteroate synthase, partial [Pseudomonadales bacterium]|nr:dihydropteroate synthase [Pseudomonadales bacterium]